MELKEALHVQEQALRRRLEVAESSKAVLEDQVRTQDAYVRSANGQRAESDAALATKDREAATAIAAHARNQRELDEVRLQVEKHAAAVVSWKVEGSFDPSLWHRR